MQSDKFQRFIFSSQQNAMSMFYKHGVLGFSSNTIVINNAKRKKQIIDTKDDF